jgi:hypothetical protein
MATPDDASQTIKDASGSTSIEDPDRKKASGTCSSGLQEKSERGKKDTSGRPDAKDASRQTYSTAQMNSRRVAHIAILPPELLTQIFQYLSLSDRLHFRFVPLLLIFLAPRSSARCIHRSLRLIRRKIGRCVPSSQLRWSLFISLSLFSMKRLAQSTVAGPDPNPYPPDPHVFGPPGSGSISQRYDPAPDPDLDPSIT